MLGLIWDPEKDERYQRERLIRNAESWLFNMDLADKNLAKGNVQAAGNWAYEALEHFPEASLPILREVHARARSIIAQLPSDFKPPAPTPRPVLPRMSARDAFAKLEEASTLKDAGKIEEAYELVNEVHDHKLYSVRGAHAVDAELTAFSLRVSLNEIISSSLKSRSNHSAERFSANTTADQHNVQSTRGTDRLRQP